MNMTHANMAMHTRAVPFVAAYGFSSRMTIMGRTIYKNISTSNGMSSGAGLDGLMLMGKFRLLRRNSEFYTLGLSAIVGGEVPFKFGKDNGKTSSIRGGLLGSLRRRPAAIDVNLAFSRSTTAREGSINLNNALAWVIPIRSSSQMAFTPVIEFTRNIEMGKTTSGVSWVSPGFKLTISSFILEGLVNFPLSDTAGMIEYQTGSLLGLRIMI